MGRRGKAPRAAVSVDGIRELSVGRHRSLHKSPTPGGKRSTSISRKRQRSQSPRPAAAAIAGISFGRFVISPTPRRRSTSRKRLPKGEGPIVSEPANLCSSQTAAGIGGAIISTKMWTLRHVEDDIEKAGSAKKQKTVSEKVVPVKNDLKVKKKLPPKKVDSSSSDEYSSESEDEIRSSLQHLRCGDITRVSIAKDYDTCVSKGIADMEFIDNNSLPKALELSGYDLGGCSLSVDEAKPSPDIRDGADSDRGHGQSGAPPRQSSGTPSAAPNCMDYGLILVLFETPSGFAIFSLYEHWLTQLDALENIWANFGEHFRCQETVWLEDFQTFEDKSTAITHGTGVTRELTDMILRCRLPCQKLAVGKPEYKTIIEESLGIHCLFDETVMEVMWGLKNIMHSLVPEEEVKLTKEDRLPMSKGLMIFLNRHGFDLKPEMVNEKIVVLACVLLDCEYIDKKNYTLLGVTVDLLKDTSGFNAEGWDLMKLATALMIMRNPAETNIADKEMFTGDELLKLEMDAHKYGTVISKDLCFSIYKEIVETHECRTVVLKKLQFRVKEAKEAWKVEQNAVPSRKA